MAGIVGPHEGKEFELFATGSKDLIFFGEDGLPENYQQWATKVGAQEHQFSAGRLNGFVLYRQGHHQDAIRLGKLVQDSLSRPANPVEIEREIGRLLGYDEQDIEAYVEQFQARHGAK